ncbi:hypothetical protein INT47_011956 [Mucor saturninus]|uniref:Muskelin n=1 Tax=Mucor saturninus TaxID=64648 RepID=A0A8H7R7Q8_9FUNG|nr:hypothetical protein INT47_011956 [Mucor saturninus]
MNSLLSRIAEVEHKPLSYTIYDQSSQSGSYHSRNICIDDPTEQSSRWSSGSHDQSQFITLKLDNPSVACDILFGKFHRSHVCNLKEFKIYGGMDPLEMNELLHKGLTDDNKPETFPIRYTFNDLVFPIQYIKIVPLATFGAKFNYSIWYVQVKGVQDPEIMSQVYSAFIQHKERETIRMCLKHFRQKNMMDVYETLKSKTGIEIEHPMVEKLHKSLVINGDFDQAEQVILDADKKAIFHPFVKESSFKPDWKKLDAFSDEGIAPCARGGHQLCIDPEREKIYLFGGWDGKVELADFWCYHIKDNCWKLLSSDTTSQGGPSPRSCHTMCYDPTRKTIYVLGRYKEYQLSPSPDPASFESEFFQYFIELDRWVKISDSTLLDGGPPLLYYHEMCVDPISRKLFVFGGLVLTPDPAPATYGGFYSFDLDQCKWKILRYDTNYIQAPLAPPATPPNFFLSTNSTGVSFVCSPNSSLTIKSRAGHSMLLDSKNQKIYIFRGQRSKECLNDLQCYSIQQDKLITITQDFSKIIGPELGYTQRAAIDVETQELYIYFGLFQNRPADVVYNCFWVYSINHNTWEKVFENDNQDAAYWSKVNHKEPYPRYSHQMVYSPKSKTYFIFGGHPGDRTNVHRRLDDFWMLKLTKPDTNQVVRRCQYLLRAQKLHELCKQRYQKYDQHDINKDTQNALEYLRRHVTPLVNHENKEEIEHFKQLCMELCISQDNNDTKSVTYSSQSIKDDNFLDRTNVFQALLEFFPGCMKEPTGTLIDAVKIL